MLTVEDVSAMVRRQLGGRLPSDADIRADTELDELGLSSLQISDIIFSIEEELGIEFDSADAADITTVGGLVELANATKSAAA